MPSSDLLDSLADGTLGVTFRPDPSWERHPATGHSAYLSDHVNGIVWQAHFSEYGGLNLRPEEKPILLQDLHRSARILFDTAFETYRANALNPNQAPRTDDPKWTPIINVAFDQVGGHPGLVVLSRLAYEQGSEIVMGRVLLPLVDGVVELSCTAQDTTTGGRESVLMMLGMQGGRSLDDHPGQAFFDDPRHDAQFPHHALSRARREIWRLVKTPGMVEVHAPAPVMPRHEVRLPEQGCAFAPPPRYVELPTKIRHRDKTRVLARFNLSCNDDPPWQVNVRCEGKRLKSFDEKSLESLLLRAGSQSNLELTFDPVPFFGTYLEAECELVLSANGIKRRRYERWISAEDGTLWRVGISGGHDGPPKEVALSDLRDIARTWRRI